MATDISKFQGKTLSATSTVIAYQYPDISSNTVNQYSSGQTIGVIDSWVADKYGNNFWQIYPNNVITQTPFYILIDPFSLSVPGLNINDINFVVPPPAVIDTTQPIGVEISEGLSNVGTGISDLFSNIGTYVPYIIGGVVLIAFLPTILNSFKKNK